MVTQSNDDLKKYLKENYSFICRSCEAYDNGYPEESKRLAVAIRTLVHDTQNSESLFKQLDIKDNLYLDTCSPKSTTGFGNYGGLVLMHHSENGEWEFTPKCYLPPKPGETFSNKNFDKWWNGIVITDNNNNEFTRKQLVLALANKVGGAHVDPKLNDKFDKLFSRGSHGVSKIEDEATIPIQGLELASVRQIAFELLSVLKNEI